MIYLASPYTHEDPAVRYYRVNAVTAARNYWRAQGFQIYSPIAHWDEEAKHCDFPTDHEWWWFHNKYMLDSWALRLWILKLPGWLESEGVQREIRYCTEKHMPLLTKDMPIRMPDE